MALQMRARPQIGLGRAPRLTAPRVVCKAVTEDKSSVADKAKSVAMAGLVASLLLGSAIAPEEALAARSGGRVSSSGFSSRRAAPAKAAP
jgi:hypothetical protein